MKLGARFKKKQPAPVAERSPTRDAYGFVVKPELVGEYEVNAARYVNEEEERATRWDGFLSRGEDGSLHTPVKVKPASDSERETADGGGSAGASGGVGGGGARRSLDDALSREAAAADGAGEGGEPRTHGDEIKSNDTSTCASGGGGEGGCGAGNVWRRQSLNAVVAILEGRNPGRSGETAPQRERELQALVHGGVPMALRGEMWQLFAGVQYRRRPGLYRRLVKAAGEPLPLELAAEAELEDEREREETEEAASVPTPSEATRVAAAWETAPGETDGARAGERTKGDSPANDTIDAAPETHTPKINGDADGAVEDATPRGGFATPPSTLPALHTPLTSDATATTAVAERRSGSAASDESRLTSSNIVHVAAMDSPASVGRSGAEHDDEVGVCTPSPGLRDVLPEIEESVFARIKEQIEKDLPRTFPAHPLLDGIGRDALKRVLFAYARHNPSVGYCQGMNFLAALLLLLMEEEAAFWCLSAICEDILPGYFTNTMLASAVDQAVLQALVEERFPNIAAALESNGVPLAAVSASWFLTLYVNQLPWECALRVWDVLLFERTRAVLFQTALALIDLSAQKLLSAAAEDRLMESVATLAPGAFDGSALLAVATSGFADLTWERLLHEYRVQHRKLTFGGPGHLKSFASSPKAQDTASGRAWGQSVPLPRQLAIPPTPLPGSWGGSWGGSFDAKENGTGGLDDAGVEKKGAGEISAAAFEAWFSPGVTRSVKSRAKVFRRTRSLNVSTATLRTPVRSGTTAGGPRVSFAGDVEVMASGQRAAGERSAGEPEEPPYLRRSASDVSDRSPTAAVMMPPPPPQQALTAKDVPMRAADQNMATTSSTPSGEDDEERTGAVEAPRESIVSQPVKGDGEAETSSRDPASPDAVQDAAGAGKTARKKSTSFFSGKMPTISFQGWSKKKLPAAPVVIDDAGAAAAPNTPPLEEVPLAKTSDTTEGLSHRVRPGLAPIGGGVGGLARMSSADHEHDVEVDAADAAATVEALRRRLVAVEEELGAMRLQHGALVAELASKEELVQAREFQLASATELCACQREELTEREAEVEARKADVAARDALLRTRDAELAERDVRVASLTEELAAARAQIAAVAKAVTGAPEA